MNPNVAKLRHAKAAHAQLDRSQISRGDNMHGEDHGQGHEHHDHSELNVGEFERQISMISGTVLAVCGLLRGSLSGLGLAAIGAGLIWRGHTGHCEVYHALGHSSAEEKPVAV